MANINEEKEKQSGGINDPVLNRRSEGGKPKVCPHCKQEYDKVTDVCPHCGHYLFEGKTYYEPMDKNTIWHAKWIIGIICVAVFIALVAFGVVKLSGPWGCSPSDSTGDSAENLLLPVLEISRSVARPPLSLPHIRL